MSANGIYNFFVGTTQTGTLTESVNGSPTTLVYTDNADGAEHAHNFPGLGTSSHHEDRDLNDAWKIGGVGNFKHISINYDPANDRYSGSLSKMQPSRHTHTVHDTALDTSVDWTATADSPKP